MTTNIVQILHVQRNTNQGKDTVYIDCIGFYIKFNSSVNTMTHDTSHQVSAMPILQPDKIMDIHGMGFCKANSPA